MSNANYVGAHSVTSHRSRITVMRQTLSMEPRRRDAEEKGHGHGGQNEEDARKPHAVRRSAFAIVRSEGLL
jgi:hypothetical protein